MAKIFILKLFKMVAWTEVCHDVFANHVKFIEECVMSSEKYVLVKNMLTIGLNKDLLLRVARKDSSNSQLSRKEKIFGSVKKVMLTVFWDMKESITGYFLKKRCDCKQWFQLPSLEIIFTLLNDPLIIQFYNQFIYRGSLPTLFPCEVSLKQRVCFQLQNIVFVITPTVFFNSFTPNKSLFAVLVKKNLHKQWYPKSYS